MAVTLSIAAFLAGFAILTVAGDALVRGADALARRGGVPPLIVGLTIVAFGTSAPEVFVSVQAVLSDEPGLALGNIVGSNIANILVVLSIPTLFAAIPMREPGVRLNAVIMTAATAAFLGLSLRGALGPWQGALLISGILAFTVAQIVRARRGAEDVVVEELADIEGVIGEPRRWLTIWTSLAAGLIGLPAGAALIVWGGVGLAGILGVPSAFVGLTLVAVGTSLPELTASVIAAIRKQPEVAIGNVIGSNIFNLLAVGGAAAMAGTMAVPASFWVWDFPVMAATALLLLALALTRRPIGRWTGLVLFAGYVVYIFRLAQIQGLT